MYVVTTMVKPILRILGGSPVHGLSQGFLQRLPGAGLGLAQQPAQVALVIGLGGLPADHGQDRGQGAGRDPGLGQEGGDGVEEHPLLGHVFFLEGAARDLAAVLVAHRNHGLGVGRVGDAEMAALETVEQFPRR